MGCKNANSANFDLAGEVQLGRKVHGPALTLRIPIEKEEVSLDMAVVISTQLPIPSSVQWPRRDAKWPSEEKCEAVKRAGIIFVAKHPYYWYMSFSNCEKELISKIDQVIYVVFLSKQLKTTHFAVKTICLFLLTWCIILHFHITLCSKWLLGSQADDTSLKVPQFVPSVHKKPRKTGMKKQE